MKLFRNLVYGSKLTNMKLKQLITVVVTGLLVCLFSCQKTIIGLDCCTANIPMGAIVGNWGIVGDTVNRGVNTGVPVIYTGKPGDYFDFRPDGHVYIKEGATLDTLIYSVVSNDQIIFPSFVFLSSNDTCKITVFTANKLVIASPINPLPAGPQERRIGLSR